ncbi:hypothetical protein ACKZDW_07975 [Ralstonia syzygii subsp. celebesensis]
MQALHDEDDRRVLAVLPAFQRVLKPVDDTLPDDIALGLVGLVRVVNDDRAAEALAVLARAEAGDRAPAPAAYITPPSVVVQWLFASDAMRQAGKTCW